jgi:hypothetical protein
MSVSKQSGTYGFKWHAAGRVNPSNSNKKKWRSSGKPSALRSRLASRNANGNTRACSFPGNASPQQLEAAANSRHRQMLEQAIAELDRQLSSFKQVTDSAAQE